MTGPNRRMVGWWRSRSLRARLTIVATTLLGAGLAAAAVLLTATVGLSMQAALDAGALQSARDVAALVDADRLPAVVPVGGVSTAEVQVVDSAGRVLAASAGADRLVSLLDSDQLRRARAGSRLYITGDGAGIAGLLRVIAVPAGTPSQPRTVVVAVDVSVVRDSIRMLSHGVLIGAPLLLILGAAVSWRVIGWTLRPVEELRRGAAEITGTGAGAARRLPVPAARDELRRLAVTLNDMLSRLAAASARQRAFVSDAAHELRSPLASIRTQVEVAARLGTAETADLATDVLVDVERLARLVDDLLLLARLDEAAPVAPPRRYERVAIRELADEAVRHSAPGRVPVRLLPAGSTPANGTRPADPAWPADRARPADQARPAHRATPANAAPPADRARPADQAPLADGPRPADPTPLADQAPLGHRATPANAAPPADRARPADQAPLTDGARPADRQRPDGAPPADAVRPDPDGLAVLGDRHALCRALVNLLDNAVRHAASGVTVEVTGTGDRVTVTVADDGPGIPAADRDRVFDRFTRLDTARSRDAGGAGLGLAIAREVVRAHGGTVSLSDASPGLRATIILPAARATDPGRATTASPPRP